MTPSPSSQTPARARWRWRWGRIVLLGLVAGIGALGWNQYTWHRAVRQLEEAGIREEGKPLGARLWETAQGDWRQLFNAATWKTEPIVWKMALGEGGQLRNLDALAPALRRINPKILGIHRCLALENVNGLQGLTALHHLSLFGCEAMENVDGLKGLTALRKLDLSGCAALQNVDGLKGLTALQSLDLSGCEALRNVDGLMGLTALGHLNLSSCAILQNVDGLKGLTALQSLWLDGCPALQNVDGLKGRTALGYVGLRGCTKLAPEEVAALRAALPNAEIQDP